jgi:NAD(P) transhydrogenase subunit alpha
MVKTMRPGSVIVDMAAEMGGNTELTEAGKEIVTDNGVRIIGFTNLPASMPASATQMYAKNIQTLVKHLVTDGKLEPDFSDEITAGATITHGGKVVHAATAEALGIKAPKPPAAAEPAAEPAAEETGTDAPAEAGERDNA